MSRTVNGHPPQSARELLEETSRLRKDLLSLAESGERTVRDWRRYVRRRAEQQPYATLLVAAGFGYLLGGGLPTSVVRLALGVGGRLAAERVLNQLAQTIFETQDP